MEIASCDLTYYVVDSEAFQKVMITNIYQPYQTLIPFLLDPKSLDLDFIDFIDFIGFAYSRHVAPWLRGF